MRILILLINIHVLCAACVQISRDHILGADLARAFPAFAMIPPQEFIGFSPAVGYQRVFSTRQLNAIGSKFGFVADSGSEVCFERKTEILDAQGILAAMRSELGRNSISIEIVDFSRHPVPKGALVFPRSGLMQPPISQSASEVLWKGEIHDDSGHVTPVWAKVLITEERDHVVAAAPIQAGQTLSQDQVRVERVQSFPFAQATPAALTDIIGQTARIALHPGQVLTRSHVKPPMDVKRGDTVRATVISAGTRIQFSAQAKSAGRAGEWVLVQNPMTKKNFRARVEGPGRVTLEVQ